MSENKVKKVEMFECPETGKLFSTESLAKSSATKARNAKVSNEAKRVKEKELEIEVDRKRNFLRLNCDDFTKIPEMLVKCAKEFYDIDITDINMSDMTFTNKISNSHSSPIDGVTNWCGKRIDAPSGYPGWSGRMKCRATVPKKDEIAWGDSITNILKHKFVIFNSGTGCPGCAKVKTLKTEGTMMNIEMRIFIDDLPILKERYGKYLIEKAKVDKNDEIVLELENTARSFASNDKQFLALATEIENLQNKKTTLYSSLKNDFFRHNTVFPIPISDDYETLRRNFQSRF